MEGQFEKNGNPYAPQAEYQQNPYTPQPVYSQGNAQPNPYMQQPVYGQEAPQENYKKPMRKAYCRVEWKIFLYAVIAVAAQTLYALAVPELFGKSVYAAEWYTWGMMIIPMYMIAFPILYLIGGKKDRVKIMQHKMGFGKWLIAALMCAGICAVGMVIGTILDTVISLFTQSSSTDAVTLQNLMLNSNPIYRILTVGILAPMVEEMIFRKFIIDRTVKYGEGMAVLTSGLMFGLFHGNFSQCFFAAGLGMLFAYIYIRTGRIRYTIFLHMAVNLTTSIGSVGILQWVGYDELLSAETSGNLEALMGDMLPKLIVLYAWLGFLACLAIAGIVLLIIAFAKKKFFLVKPPKHVAKGKFAAAWINWGMLLFMIYILFIFITNYM